MNDAPPPAPPPLPPARRPSVLVTALFLIAALPLLGFTACGLVVAASALFSTDEYGFWQIGLGCLVVGSLALWGLSVAYRRVRERSARGPNVSGTGS